MYISFSFLFFYDKKGKIKILFKYKEKNIEEGKK